MQPKVGVSSCLLGYKVRYDGKSKTHPLIVERLSTELELIAICPEIGMGMSVPRPPIHIRHGNLMSVSARAEQYNDKMIQYIETLAPVLSTLSGYICKAKSPSCGLHTTPHWNVSGDRIVEYGEGFFTQLLKERYPNLLVIEDTELIDSDACKNFLNKLQYI